MSKRWDKLGREFGLPAENPAADKNRVLDLVFARPDIVPEGSRQGRVIFVSKKFKTALIALLVLALSSGTVLAASHFGLLSEVFDGDTSYLANSVKKPNASVTDGRFTLTVEEYLATENQVMVLFSVKAESAEALAELTATDERGSDTFWDSDTLSFYAPDADRMLISGWGVKPYPDENTKDTLHYIFTAENMDNPERLPVVLRLNKMAEPNSITLDMTTNIVTKSFQLSDDLSVNINPIGLTVEQHLAEAQPEIMPPEIFFRTAGGDILTNAQIYEMRSGFKNETGEDINITTQFIAKKIIDPEQLSSIIVDGAEYSLADGTYLGKPQIPAELKPFIVNAYQGEQGENSYGMPLDEIAAHIGASWQFNAATGQAVMTYRGTTVALTAGQKTATINGREEKLPEYQEAQRIDANGHFILYAYQILDLFDIAYEICGDWRDLKPIMAVRITP